MTSILDESFDTAPPIGFYDLSGWGTSLPTVTYNSTASALDMQSTDGSAMLIMASPLNGGLLTFEADVELVSDPNNRKHLGVWLSVKKGKPTGYRICHLDNLWNVSFFTDFETEVVQASTILNNMSFNVGERRRLRVTYQNGAYTLSANEVPVITFTSTLPPIDLYPGVFGYVGVARVHRVIVERTDAISISLASSGAAIPANQEPRSQFEPQDVAWRGSPPLFAGPVQAPKLTPLPMIKGRDYFWLRDGVRNVEQGYIESTVTIDGEGVRRRVLCFTQDGDLVAETYSRASDGKYRFDLLWLNRRYMLVAQDDPAFGPADYNAVAADFQLPTPYAPGEGVGLV